MTKNELVEKICAGQDGLTKKSGAQIVDTLFTAMQSSISAEEKFSYPGFGTFVVRSRKERTGRNPRTGETMQIAASKTVGFKPAKAFKDAL